MLPIEQTLEKAKIRDYTIGSISKPRQSFILLKRLKAADISLFRASVAAVPFTVVLLTMVVMCAPKISIIFQLSV